MKSSGFWINFETGFVVKYSGSAPASITLEQFHLHQTEEIVSQPPHLVFRQKCNGTRYFGDKGP